MLEAVAAEQNGCAGTASGSQANLNRDGTTNSLLARFFGASPFARGRAPLTVGRDALGRSVTDALLARAGLYSIEMYDHTQYFVVMENCLWNRWLVRPHTNANHPRANARRPP